MKKLMFKTIFVQILYWLANVCVAAFTTSYLTSYGFDELQIGLIMSVSAIFTIVFNFIIDEVFIEALFNHIKRTVVFTYLACFTLSFCFILIGQPNVLTLIIFALICSLMTHNQRLINILCNRQNDKHYLTDGNRPANYGLISYGISTLLIGYTASKTTIRILLNLYLVFIIIATVAVIILLDDKTAKQTKVNVKGNFDKAIALTRKNKEYVLFLSASCASAIGSMAALKYLIRIITITGGNTFNLGIALMIQTTITLPITTKSREIIKKYEPGKLLTVSFLFSFLKILLLLIALLTKNIYIIYLSMSLSILGYGLFGFSSAAFTKQLNSQGDFFIAHKLALLVSSFGFGPLLGGILGGLIMQYRDISLLLIVCCCLTGYAVIVQLFMSAKVDKI